MVENIFFISGKPRCAAPDWPSALRPARCRPRPLFASLNLDAATLQLDPGPSAK
jgi:hypothetical protein